MLGFEPAIRTEASGNRIAEEWYNLAMLDDESPASDQREPFGALGLYIAGVPTGPDASDW